MSANLNYHNQVAFSSERGFSLIEMLVAMVILSLSLGVLYQAAAGAIRNARVSGEYTQAVMLAESKLAEYGYVAVESFSVQDRHGLLFLVSAELAGAAT